MNNSNSTEAVEDILLYSSSIEVRRSLATYSSNANILTKLAKDKDEDVRDNVLHNADTPKEVKDYLNGE